jgi:hypothetical protein
MKEYKSIEVMNTPEMPIHRVSKFDNPMRIALKKANGSRRSTPRKSKSLQCPSQAPILLLPQNTKSAHVPHSQPEMRQKCAESDSLDQ